MSWITKAENLLNNLDKKAGSVLQQSQSQKSEDVSDNQIHQNLQQNLPKIPSFSKNMLILSKPPATTSPKKPSSLKLDQDWDSVSENSLKTQIENEPQNDEFLEIKDPVEVFSVEKELASTKILLSEYRSENTELKLEMEALQEQLKCNNDVMKIKELEEMYAVLADEKKDLILMNQSFESANNKYIKTVSELESNIMKLQKSENDLKQKLDFAKSETKDIQQELQNYKLRAQNQLQMKEKLIEQLKNGASVDVEVNDENDISTLQMESDQLRSERDHLQSELNLLSKRFDESRSFIEKLEHKHRIMEAAAEDKINALNETLNQESLKTLQCEDEIRLQKQEILQIRDEMLNQKKFMTMKLHEKENELKRLKNAYRESQVNSEIENRVQSLTQSLITKQNNLEAITAERNAMKLQLEKLQSQHQELILQMRNHRPQIINLNDTDDVKSSISNLMTINPFDSRMSRRVKRAYSNLDQFGISFGVFLRRYPLARIFAVFYVCFMHLFVFLVILHSTPSS